MERIKAAEIGTYLARMGMGKRGTSMHEVMVYSLMRGEPPQKAPHGRSDAAGHADTVSLRGDERASMLEQQSAEPATLSQPERPLRQLLPLERQSDC